MCKNIFIGGPFRPLRLVLFILAVVVPAASQPGWAQEPADEPEVDRLAVFLDCGWCFQTYIRQEMSFVDYVRDREEADVHLIVTSEQAGSGGRAYTLDLIGRGVFQGTDYSATYVSNASETEDERRSGLLRTLQAALVPYLLQTSMADRISMRVEEGEVDVQQPAEDPWKGWTIQFYGDGWGDMEASQYSVRLRYGVFVDRVTEQWKIRLRPYFNYNFDQFERGDDTITSESRRDGFDAYVIKSVGSHWSVGTFGDLFTSTFSNIDLRYRGRVGVEYSFFPYREANRRQLTVAYVVGGRHVTYNDTTIFNQIREALPEHALDAEYEVTQTWGEIDVGVEASQFLHDRSKYRVELGGGVEVRITRGLSVEFGGNVELIHDQIFLPKGDAPLEEVLLRRRQLATNFEVSGRVGFRYRIGSIYNNVVNTRF